MSHLPRNHPLRAFYRFLAALAGAFCLAFGITGLINSSGHGFFEQDSVRALGLPTNSAFAVASIIVGSAVVVAALWGRNSDRWVNLVAGPIFLVAGLLMLSLLRTEANFFNFAVSTCVVSFVIGMVLLTAGLYGHATSPEEAAQHEAFRHGARHDPDEHVYGDDPTRASAT